MPYQSPQMGRGPTPPAAQQQQYPNVGNVLADLNPDEMRADQKREGQDWYAVFNPNIRRILDIDLVNTLVHDSVVCCVRFSYDGKYVATGCNRSAQIFEVASGNQVVKLQDESVEKDGDLYIRSVCFSPDGMYLATGAEDKVIRVSQTPSPQVSTYHSTNECATIGLGHYIPHHPSHFLRPRARHLFPRLLSERSQHCFRLRRPHRARLGYRAQL